LGVLKSDLILPVGCRVSSSAMRPCKVRPSAYPQCNQGY